MPHNGFLWPQYCEHCHTEHLREFSDWATKTIYCDKCGRKISVNIELLRKEAREYLANA